MSKNGYAHQMPVKHNRKEKPQPRIVDARNRVALSPETMRLLDVEAGDYVVFEPQGRDVVVRKVDWSVRRG